MALETWGPNATPADLNVNWPEGRDDLKFGDDHIRLLKTALKNFYTATTALNKVTADALTVLEGKFTGPDAKNALLLEGKNLEFVRAAANIVGKIEEKNLEFGTTTRKGIVQLSSAIDSADELVGANSKAAKTAFDKGSEALAKANSVDSTAIRLGPVQSVSSPGPGTTPAWEAVPSNSVLVRGAIVGGKFVAYYRRIL